MEGDEMNSLKNEVPPNYQYMSVWHWLVVIGTALGTILSGILPHSFGTLIAGFQLPSNNNFNQTLYIATQFQLNSLPATSSAFPCIFLPLFAFFVHRLNRSYQILSVVAFIILAISCGLSSLVNTWALLFLTYSLLYSLGSSIYLAVTIIILAEYFPVDHKYHILATSLFQVGYPAASFIGNPFLAAIIVNYGWKSSLKVISIIIIVFGVFISCFMKPIREKNFGKHADSKSDVRSTDSHEPVTLDKSKRWFSSTSLIHFITTYEIWPWLVAKFINYMCWYGLRTNIVTYLVKSKEFTLFKSATLMATYSGAEIVVALFSSVCGDRFRGFLVHVHIFSAIAMATLTGIYTVVITTYFSAILIMICVGISIQFSLSFGYPASVEVLKSKFDMKTGWIFTNVAAGLGILASPFFSGILMDYLGVSALLYSQCVGWILQALLYLATLIILKMNSKNNTKDYEEIDLVK